MNKLSIVPTDVEELNNGNHKRYLTVCTFDASFDTQAVEGIDDIVKKYIDKYTIFIFVITSLCKGNYDHYIRMMKSNGLNYVRHPENFNKEKGEIIFTSIIPSASSYDFFKRSSSNIHRGCTTITLKIGNIPLTVSTSQLDNDHSIRQSQFNETVKIVENTRVPSYIILGDFNIPSYQTSHLIYPKNIIDSWRENGTNDNESTRLNGDRSDRILYSSDMSLVCNTYDILTIKNIDNKIVLTTFTLQ